MNKKKQSSPRFKLDGLTKHNYTKDFCNKIEILKVTTKDTNMKFQIDQKRLSNICTIANELKSLA